MKTLTEVVMPQLAESLVSATIERWLKQPGNRRYVRASMRDYYG